MHDSNVRSLIIDEMVEAEIVEQQGNTLSYFHNGREYLVLVTVADVTDWQQEA